jgi:hypothetical protein
VSDPIPTLVGHLQLSHRALERLFACGAALAAPDAAGLEAATTALRAHHLLEDEVLVPLLRRKGAAGPWDQIGADHRDLVAQLTARDLAGLARALPAHFALEEAVLTEPFWRGLLTAEEATAFGKEVAAHSREHLKPAAQLLPLMLYNLDPAERERFTARMPRFVTAGLVPFVFRSSWRGLRPWMAHAPARWTA